MITEVRNARSMNATNTVIDVEINHPDYGWIPYLLTEYDTDTTINNDAVMALIGNTFAAYVPPTQAELDEAAAQAVRATRDMKIAAEVDPIAGNALRWAALDADTQAAWAAYRQALLDVPAQAGFPHNVTWPEVPSV
ncbi:MAG: tail fiber assembly protein [Bacteroidota bacterium]